MTRLDTLPLADHFPSTVILRHGPTEWNEQLRWQGGEVDHPLSSRGRKYVVAMARELLTLGLGAQNQLVSSPMRRALETADILRTCGIGKGPIIHIAELREAQLGATSGLTESEVESRFPQLFSDWVSGKVPSYPQGESLVQITERVGGMLAKLLQFERPVVAIAHKTVLRAIRLIVGIPELKEEGHLSGVGRWVIQDHPGRAVWVNIAQTPEDPRRSS